MADRDRVPHAILFHGDDGCGAFALALALVQYLNCASSSGEDSCGKCPSCNQNGKLIYPDVIFSFPFATSSKVKEKSDKLTASMFSKHFKELALVNPYFTESELNAALGVEDKLVSIPAREAREILSRLSISSVTSGWRAIIMLCPEKLHPTAANSLLKIIEEPSEKTIFILITHDLDGVLPTIRSRCQSIAVSPVPKEDLADYLMKTQDVAEDYALAAAGFANGSIGKALLYLSGTEDVSGISALFADMMEAVMEKDYSRLLAVSEEIVALGSREKQKAFCNFAAECIRKAYMIKLGLPDLAGLDGMDASLLGRIAASAKEGFFEGALAAIGRAALFVERNVNQKLVFCNLAGRIFFSYN